jgi:anti-anti-sigma factor
MMQRQLPGAFMSNVVAFPLTFLDAIFLSPAEWDADTGVVWLRGEHDISTTPVLSEVISQALAVADANLILDLSEVLFMDASTVAVFARTQESLGARSRSLVLRSPSRCANRVLDLCGFGDLVLGSPVATIHPLEHVVALRALAERSRPMPRHERIVGRASLRLVLAGEARPDEVVDRATSGSGQVVDLAPSDGKRDV